MDDSAASIDFVDAFSKVNNSTRLTIIRELARVRAESPHSPSVSFSELRERIGDPDSGTFNYHLNQLDGVFIRKENDGYVLSPEGRRFAAIVAAGGMNSKPVGYPYELDDQCPVCSEPLTLDYRRGALGVECQNNHQYATRVPHSVVQGRSVEEAIEIFTKYSRAQVEFARDRYCPSCFNDMDCQIIERGEPGEGVVRFEGVCHDCGELLHIPISLLLAYHPAVAALHLLDDSDFQQYPIWKLKMVTDSETTVVDRDPLRVTVTFKKNGDEVVFSVDESAQISVDHSPD